MDLQQQLLQDSNLFERYRHSTAKKLPSRVLLVLSPPVYVQLPRERSFLLVRYPFSVRCYRPVGQIVGNVLGPTLLRLVCAEG